MRGVGQTSSQASRGRFLLSVLAAALLVGRWGVPEYAPTAPAGSAMRGINGIAWRHDDAAEVGYFLASLRDHGGVLCLGTSETTGLPAGNWPDFLNATDPRHAVLAGAGRTAGVYLPILARHASELRGLRLIYYINPVYWNAEHGPVNGTYWDRYVDPLLLHGADSLPSAIRQPIEDGRAALGASRRLNPSGLVRRARKAWYKDVRRWFNPADFTAAFSPIRRWEGEPPPAPSPSLDPERGVESSFQHAEWFQPISDDADVVERRNNELRGFIAACDRWGIEATFILGPHNAPFIRHHAPEAEAGYAELGNDLAQILIDHQAHWVDARPISHVPGAFRDHQHHSSYGAALIAQLLLADGPN